MRLSIDKVGDWANTPIHRFNWEEIAQRFHDDAGPSTQDALKAECPRKPVWDHPERGAPGTMAESIDRGSEIGESSAKMRFEAHTPYAGYVVHGTAPHPIDPRVKRWLHWVDPGGEHFRKHVEHPGATANHFPDRVLMAEGESIAEKFSRAVEDTVKER